MRVVKKETKLTINVALIATLLSNFDINMLDTMSNNNEIMIIKLKCFEENFSSIFCSTDLLQ